MRKEKLVNKHDKCGKYEKLRDFLWWRKEIFWGDCNWYKDEEDGCTGFSLLILKPRSKKWPKYAKKKK